MDHLRPYEILNVGIVGAVRCVICNFADEAAPTDISDFVGMESPYTEVGDWFNAGASVSNKGYKRGMDSESIDIQEETGALFDDITDTNRTFTVPFSELTPVTEQIIENAPSVETIAAVAGASAQKAVPLTSITELTTYRVAFIGVRRKESGVVVESDGRTRGRLVARVLNRCTVSSDDVESQYEKGKLAEASVDFVAFPDNDVDPDDGDWGRTLFEEAGTIT